jgi:hypothetical protein
VEITYQLDPGAWAAARRAREQHAPGDDYDSTLTPRYDLLTGRVQWRRGDEVLFPHDAGINVSVLDLAVQLAEEIGHLAVDGSLRPVEVELLDPRVRLVVQPLGAGDEVEVTCDRGAAQPLRAPIGEVVAAVHAFVAQVVDEASREAPGLLDFDSAAALRAADGR